MNTTDASGDYDALNEAAGEHGSRALGSDAAVDARTATTVTRSPRSAPMVRSLVRAVRTGRVRRALATLAFWLIVALSLSFSARGRSTSDPRARPTSSAVGNPLRSLARPLAPPEHLRGAVRERLVAGSYAYLRVATGPGQERWLATIGAGRSQGECVDVTAYAMAPSFDSPRLHRRFESLLFGSARPCR